MTIGRIIDVSSAQHPNGAAIDWGQVKAAGVTTAIVKATQGTNYTNPFYASDVAGAKAAGLDVLAYHFAGWGAAALEADYFKSVAGPLARILDIETSTNVTWARAFLQTLGLPPTECMTYGSVSTFKDFYAQLPSLAWPAAYGQNYPGWGVLWQFTSTASIPGITGLVDEDRWYGTQVQYETLFGLYHPPPHPPILEDDMELHTTRSDGVQFIIASDLSHKQGLPSAADAQSLLATGLYKSVTLDDALINAIPG